LIADLERSDVTKEAGGGYKNDEYRRRSTVLDEKPNLDWLAVELEVFGKVSDSTKSRIENGT